MSERKQLKMVSPLAQSQAGETSQSSAVRGAVPDPEVRAGAKRRPFSAADKLSVLEQADRLSESGAIGALLRRAGLYSSHLSTWRREREAGALEALSRRRGRRAKLTSEQKRMAALEAENAQLKRGLEQARPLIEVPKKLCTRLGLPTAAGEERTGSDS
jgi:transposase-like protein